MPTTHQVKLIVTIDKKILSTPDCTMLPIKVGDSVNFSSPHGEFAVEFPDPHVFSASSASTAAPTLAVVSAGPFAGACSITLPGGELISADGAKGYGLSGVSEGGQGGQQPPQTAGATN